MSNTKRLYFPKAYALLDGIASKPCDHSNYDEYFEMCPDCKLPYESIYQQEIERAEALRDEAREDGRNV